MNGIFFAYQTGKSGSEVVFLLPQIIGFQIVQAVLQVLFHHDPGTLAIVLAKSVRFLWMCWKAWWMKSSPPCKTLWIEK